MKTAVVIGGRNKIAQLNMLKSAQQLLANILSMIKCERISSRISFPIT